MKNRFKPGDKIRSIDGDIGIVKEVGMRPDVRNNILGVYAYWLKEEIAFWMDMEEPSIELYSRDFWKGNPNIN